MKRNILAENYRAKSYYRLYDLKIYYYSKEYYSKLESKDNTHPYVANNLENYKIDLYISETKLNSDSGISVDNSVTEE